MDKNPNFNNSPARNNMVNNSLNNENPNFIKNYQGNVTSNPYLDGIPKLEDHNFKSNQNFSSNHYNTNQKMIK